jgi:predicted dehydrogenase
MSNSSSKVKIGFVGVGFMGQMAHLRNYVNVPECEVVAIAEIRPEVARRVAKKYDVPRVYASHEEMFAKEKLDGIVASHSFVRHGVLMPELLKARVPLFTEKPLAGSIEAGERVLRALAESGTWLMVGYHKRSDPATMAAKAEIDRLKQTRELGKLKYVRVTMPVGDWVARGEVGFVNSPEAPPSLEVDPPATDMDAKTNEKYIGFVNYYIHQINLLRHLLGEPYRVAYADPNQLLLIATTESGVTATIELNPYQTTMDWQESALVGFEKGYVKIELPAPLAHNRPGRVEFLRDPGAGATPQTIVPQMPWVHAMQQQATNFVRAIKGEIKPPCEAPEALDDLKIARDYLRLVTGK